MVELPTGIKKKLLDLTAWGIFESEGEMRVNIVPLFDLMLII